ncbi:MAG TPA: phospholipase D-like domain-containing protein [Candidatus Saccharimonadia bacterium]|nr:phospholipase D-like domain-containing protein [Candidatus Saccharimonadia bacterium]
MRQTSSRSSKGNIGSSFGAHLATAVVSGVATAVLARNFFESEKKITHPIVTNYGVEQPPFCRTISHLLGTPFVGGNNVEALNNGVEIFPAMLDAIRRAEHTITFENFVFTSGRVTRQFAGAFAERALAGVKVQVLQDAMGCDCIDGEEFEVMRRAGVEVEVFRYINLQFNERTHRKLLVVDGKVGFIGGVGISDDWDGDADEPDHWRDTQYFVEGPVVAQMQQAFMDNWIQTRAEVLHGDFYFPQLERKNGMECQVFKSSSSEGADSARLLFLFAIAAARRSIRIANAYFIPDDLTIQTLVEARVRNVDIEVIVPGELTDQHLVRKVGRTRWRKMIEAGIKFYEYQPSRFHCKYMIVDGHLSCVGSCNLDNRSLRLNEEANLNILDREFAAEHLKIFEQDKAKSREITLEEWRARPLGEKVVGLLGCVLRSQL